MIQLQQIKRETNIPALISFVTKLYVPVNDMIGKKQHKLVSFGLFGSVESSKVVLVWEVSDTFHLSGVRGTMCLRMFLSRLLFVAGCIPSTDVSSVCEPASLLPPGYSPFRFVSHDNLVPLESSKKVVICRTGRPSSPRPSLT